MGNSDLPKVISKMKFVTGLLTIAVLAFFTGVVAKAKPQSVNANVKVSINGGDQASVTNTTSSTTPYCKEECPPPMACECWCASRPTSSVRGRSVSPEMCGDLCPELVPCACDCSWEAKNVAPKRCLLWL